MILIIGLKLKTLTQDSYDEAIQHIKNELKNSALSLFGFHERIIFYGFYTRTFVSDSLPCEFPLKIQRIYCVNSRKTHALTPSCLVPYSNIPLKIQLEIIDANDEELSSIANRCLLNHKILLRIRNTYNSEWRSIDDWLAYSFDVIVDKAFSCLKKQFLQIRGSAFLFKPPT